MVTDVSLDELKSLKSQLEDSNTNPRDVKKYLGRTIVRMYHDEEASKSAESAFEQVFVKKDIPDEMPEFSFEQDNMRIDGLLIATKTATSKNEARRLITQGGVSVDGEKIDDLFKEVKISGSKVLKVGKRKFVRISKK